MYVCVILQRDVFPERKTCICLTKYENCRPPPFPNIGLLSSKFESDLSTNTGFTVTCKTSLASSIFYLFI